MALDASLFVRIDLTIKSLAHISQDSKDTLEKVNALLANLGLLPGEEEEARLLRPIPLQAALKSKGPIYLSVSDWVGCFENTGAPKNSFSALLQTLGISSQVPLQPLPQPHAQSQPAAPGATAISAAKLYPGGPFPSADNPSWWSRLFCSCSWRQPRNDTLLLAIMTQQLALIERLPDQIAAKLAEANDMGTVLSDPQYEEDARNWLPSQLLQRCGLIVVENVDLQRANLVGLEWDFRAPVVIGRTEPNSNTELGVFEVFPSGTPAYIRPPIVSPRNITPTKFSNSAYPPSAQYFALFEFTTSAGWANKSKRKFDGTSKTMATRLNERLAKSLDRAKDSGIISPDARITDLVAVIGVVAPTACTQSMTFTMSRQEVPLLLKEMMDANRFVVLIKPKGTLPSSSRSSPSREAEKQ